MTLLDTIKKIVFNHELKFAMYDLVDGTKVEVEGDLAPGSLAYVVDAETGERSAAPAGSHELAEPAGTSIVVNEQGVIDDVKVADSPTAETEQDMSEDAAAEVGAVREDIVEEAKEEIASEADVSEGEAQAIIEQVISIVEDKVAEVEGGNEDLRKRLDKMEEILLEMAKTQKSFSSDIDKLKKEPSGTPISKTAFSTEERASSLLDHRTNFIKKLKNS
jgi:hypothetical protein